MLRATLRWTLILACLFAVGPIVRQMLLRVLDADGGHAVTLAVNAGMGEALVGGLAAIIAAGVTGALGAHFFSMGTGFTCAGITLAWARWGLGSVDDIARRAASEKHGLALAAENGVVLALAAALAGVIVLLAARRQPGHEGRGAGMGVRDVLIQGEEYRSKAALAAAVIGAVAGAGVTWLVAFSGLRGQTLMAVLVGAIACGASGQLVASSMRCTITPVLTTLAALAAAVAGPIVAEQMHGGGVLDAANRGVLFGLAWPISLDWAAGVLLGGPIGISWAGAMLDARAVDD